MVARVRIVTAEDPLEIIVDLAAASRRDPALDLASPQSTNCLGLGVQLKVRSMYALSVTMKVVHPPETLGNYLANATSDRHAAPARELHGQFVLPNGFYNELPVGEQLRGAIIAELMKY